MFPAPSVGKTLLSPLSDLGKLDKNQLVKIQGSDLFLKKIISLAAPGLRHRMRGLQRGIQTPHCSMWHLVPWPGIGPLPRPPALGAQSLSHWTTREVPVLAFLKAWAPSLALLLPSVCCGEGLSLSEPPFPYLGDESLGLPSTQVAWQPQGLRVLSCNCCGQAGSGLALLAMHRGRHLLAPVHCGSLCGFSFHGWGYCRSLHRLTAPSC